MNPDDIVTIDVDASELSDPIPQPVESTTEEPKPKRGRPRKDDNKSETRVKPAKTVPNRRGQFIKPLEETYAMLGVVLTPFDNVCGTALLEAAPKCAESLDNLAYQNPTVRKVLAGLTETSAVMQVIVAHAPIIAAIAMHHNPMLAGLMSGATESTEEATGDTVRFPFSTIS